MRENLTKITENVSPVSILLKPESVSEEQIIKMSEVLGEAFLTYPLLSYAFPDPGIRKKKSKYFTEVMVRYGLKFGGIWVSSMNFEGINIVLPPEETFMTNYKILQCGMIKAILKIGLSASVRFLTYSDKLEAIHHKDAPYPHYFILMIGVHPNYQKQGFARRLMSPLIKKADETDIPLFLETEKEENVLVYRKLGYEIVNFSHIPGTGIPSWTMKYNPENPYENEIQN